MVLNRMLDPTLKTSAWSTALTVVLYCIATLILMLPALAQLGFFG